MPHLCQEKAQQGHAGFLLDTPSCFNYLLSETNPFIPSSTLVDTRELLAFARQAPIFSICQDEELAALMNLARLRPVKAGELVFDQGSEGDSFYVVYTGRIRILKKDALGKEINLGVCLRSDHFGETALITGCPRNAAARAVEESVLLVIDKEPFDQYLFAKPALRQYFDKFVRSTSINHFIRTCTHLGAVPPRDLQALLDNFHSEFYKEGETVFRQGADPDNFYLIESGKVKIVVWKDHSPEIVNFLREGDFFGEKALIEKTTRSADVVCLTDCHFFSLSKEDFTRLAEKSPSLQRLIENRIRSYLVEKPPIPYQELIKQELAAHKKITIDKQAPADRAAPPRTKPTLLEALSSFYRHRVSFPIIHQHDQSTCGTTCVMMIAKYYGKRLSSARLRELAHVDRSGASMANLASAAERLGFVTRGMKLTYHELGSIPLPCILHWQGYHYIVAYRIDPEHIWIADPATGLQKYEKAYFVQNWNGITLTLEPTPQFYAQSEDKSSLRTFLPLLRPHKLILFEVFLASILLNIFGLATPIFTQNIVDTVLRHQNISILNLLLLGMIIVLLFRMLTMLVRQYLIIHTSMKIDLRMLVLFYKHLMALPLGYFKARRIGDFLTRFGENIKIRNFLTNTALTLLLDTVLIVVYLSVMAYYNVQMTVIVLLLIPLLIAMTAIFTPILRRLNIDSFSARAEADSNLVESLSAIDTVKAMNLEHPIRWRWEDRFIKSLNIEFKLYNTSMYFYSMADFVGAVGSTLVLWYGARQVLQGALSVGELMAFMALMGSVMTPIGRVISAWDDIQETLVSVDRLNDVFVATPEFRESPDSSTTLVLQQAKGEIVFEGVSFRYGGQDDPNILSNLSFKILPGQRVALVGRSGSGKTTLVNLLARFYEVTQGRILLDGIDIRNVDLVSLRKLVGYVLQENFLFTGPISENISLGDPEATVERVMAAARLANAHEFISSLPSGYGTKVGESGLQLSGGQKQRIAIARVLYSNPSIVIFDEATSSLDTESEQAIQKNLEAILKKRTAIIIAHRLSTVRNADRIFVLDGGEIIEQGTHEELMQNGGLYHYLSLQQHLL